MKAQRHFYALVWVFTMSFGFSGLFCSLHAQMSAVITSTADDIAAHPWDDPDTEEDESVDGICNDGLGRCTLRAALEEAANMSNGQGVPCHVTFAVVGDLVITQGSLYATDNSTFHSNHLVTIRGGSGAGTLGISHHTTVQGLNFDGATIAIGISGDENTITDNTFSHTFTCIEVGGLRNVIGPGNIFHHMSTGILLAGDDNIVKGNRIGLDDQDSTAGYGFGVDVVGDGNIIGGMNPGDRNIISGNHIGGIKSTIADPNAVDGTTIIGNFIGTDQTSTQPKGNGYGIQIAFGRARIGGSSPSERNVISGNLHGGVETRGDALAISITGNYIGTDSSETLDVGNGTGIDLSPGSFDCLVEGNSILYNGDGIDIVGLPSDPSWNHRIKGNKISYSSYVGILISGAANDIVIGSSLSQDFAPNEIQFNGTNLPYGYGIQISGNPSLGIPRANTIRKNYFQDNHTKSIVLFDSTQDQITAPIIQNYVELGNGHALVTVTHHRPGSQIDVYEGNQTIGPNYEGGPWLGAGFEGSDTTFTVQILSSSTGSIVATATDGAENTSEFNAFTFAPLPITLLSFRGTVINGHVHLEWSTLTEINNYGFEIQRSVGSENSYASLPNSFVPGHGTTNEPHSYAFIDSSASRGRWYYRLKQIDLDGAVHY